MTTLAFLARSAAYLTSLYLLLLTGWVIARRFLPASGTVSLRLATALLTSFAVNAALVQALA